jgi:amidase
MCRYGAPVLATALETATALQTGQVSAREVLADHIARIEARNPALNAIVTLTLERAADMAARADEAFARGTLLGALHGLPVAHKDLAATAGVRTTLGSPLFADHIPQTDQLQVARQHRAGAVMVGKTNTPELGAGSHTFNSLFGVTRNPHDPSRTCGGSSGGAAVALATGMVALADGSDLGGSLRNPAAFCGVVGLRPSPGRVPSWPDSDPWGTMSVEGPMGRTVADVALFLSVLAGPDPRVAVSLDAPGSVFAGPLGREVAGLRIAWSPRLGDLPVEPEVLGVLERAMARFERLGAHVEPADPPLDGRADEVFETLRSIPMAATYGDLAAQHPERFKATIHWNIREGLRRSGVDVGRANAMRAAIFGKMHDFWARYDVLACPVTQVLPFAVETEYPTVVDGRAMASYIEWMRACSRMTVTGSPAISVPAGTAADGLPVGLQLVAPPRADRFLLEVAHAFEHAA